MRSGVGGIDGYLEACSSARVKDILGRREVNLNRSREADSGRSGELMRWKWGQNEGWQGSSHAKLWKDPCKKDPSKVHWERCDLTDLCFLLLTNTKLSTSQ
jgi:hypothetical protein